MNTVAHCCKSLDKCDLGDGFFGVINGVLYRVYDGNVWLYDKFLEPTIVTTGNFMYMIHAATSQTDLKRIKYINSKVDTWTQIILSSVFPSVNIMSLENSELYKIYVSKDYLCVKIHSNILNVSFYARKNGIELIYINDVSNRTCKYYIAFDKFCCKYSRSDPYVVDFDTTIDNRYTKVYISENTCRDIDHVMFPTIQKYSWPYDLSVHCVCL